MKISANTDIGKKRETNQDCFAKALIDGSNAAWAVVCDGMGGMAAGNVASELAVSVITKTLETNLNLNATPQSICNLLKASAEAANVAVYDIAEEKPELRGMGTTVVAAVINHDNLSLAHAGDSRAYLFSDGILTQITTDHSVVQSMVESGQLTADEAKNHPNKNIITRAIGVHEHIDVDVCDLKIKKGDIVLLCTDGLTNCVDGELLSITIRDTEFENLADKLTELANLNGGSDNITVVAILNN